MNKERRGQIQKAINLMTDAKDILEDVKSEEEDALSNIPENLQTSDRYYESEAAVDALGEAVDGLDSAITQLEEI